MKRAVLVVGSSSGIGRCIARQLAADGRELVLAARDRAELEREAANVAVRAGARAAVCRYDALVPGASEALWSEANAAVEDLEGLVICQGEMSEQAEAQRDPALVRRMIAINYTAVVELCEAAAATLEARGGGFVCVLGSVAGDRGRASNYLYGSTKAAVETYLEGLRVRLARRDVAVILVKPGLVDTRLTWGRPGPPIAAAPERVARDVARAIEARQSVVYTPSFWRWVMLAIRLLPRPVFRRLPL